MDDYFQRLLNRLSVASDFRGRLRFPDARQALAPEKISRAEFFPLLRMLQKKKFILIQPYHGVQLNLGEDRHGKFSW